MAASNVIIEEVRELGIGRFAWEVDRCTVRRLKKQSAG